MTPDKQEQFLDVIDRDEAERRFRAAVRLEPLGEETVDVAVALGRVLARDVLADSDVPSFDRSNVDGFAVRAADTFGVSEEEPRQLQLLDETITTAVVPQCDVVPGTAVAIATGAMLPRGADSVVMIEDTDTLDWPALRASCGHARHGRDIRRHRYCRRWKRCCGAANSSPVARRACLPRSARPRSPCSGSRVSESSPPATKSWRLASRRGWPMCMTPTRRSSADAVRELGAVPVPLGIVRDEPARLREVVRHALQECDVLLFSGGTSKGAGDISYRIVRDLTQPGIVAHGVALETRQTDLPGVTPRQTGGRAARLPHVGDLHLSRIRGAGHSLPGRAGRAGDTRACRTHGRTRQLGNRSHRVPAGLPRARTRAG